jgi:phosphate:Na+ symporter
MGFASALLSVITVWPPVPLPPPLARAARPLNDSCIARSAASPLMLQASTLSVLGGIGLFLLGMILMTDGLKAAAGDALRGVLARFTETPLQATVTGAGATALVQSSTATVLTTIGFVSAGLLAFPQAVGVIFGANLGTTSTGWIVSLVGLKLNIGAVAFPLVALGALLRLLGRGRVASAGIAVAGFGLIFVGIDVLQVGMRGLSAQLDPGALPGGAIGGRLLLVGFGVAMTVVMQSSSVAVATTLTALHAGTIGLEQAAALVVGQNIGTTVTAAVAAIGASVAARRTALAHIAFNVLTAGVAFLLIPAILALEVEIGRSLGDGRAPDPAVLIAAFHTGFNLLGVLMLLPFVRPFARAIERAIPERGPRLTRHLDPTVTRLPAVAVDTARRTVREIGALLVEVLMESATARRRAAHVQDRLDAADAALGEVRRFLAAVRAPAEPGADPALHLAVLHSVDHLERLAERLRAHTPSARVDDPAFRALCARAIAELPAVRAWLAGETAPPPAALAEALSAAVADERRRNRVDTLERAAHGEIEPGAALASLDAVRWLDSALYHVWRATSHLQQDPPDGAKPPGGDPNPEE